MRFQANTPGRLRKPPPGTRGSAMNRGASSARHSAASAVSAGASSGAVQKTRQWFLASTASGPARRARSASPDFAPSLFGMQATSTPPGASRASARANCARAWSRCRGGSNRTSGYRVVDASSSGSMRNPGKGRACKGQPSRPPMKSAPPSRGHASPPPAKGSNRVSRAGSARVLNRRFYGAPLRNPNAGFIPPQHRNPEDGGPHHSEGMAMRALFVGGTVDNSELDLAVDQPPTHYPENTGSGLARYQ